MARLVALFPAGSSVGAAELAAVPFEQLRAVGLSSAKATYIHDLAEKVDRGVVNLTQLPNVDDELVIQQLCAVKGIGRWTAEMFLIFSLGRLDVLAVEDMGLRAGIGAHTIWLNSQRRRRCEHWQNHGDPTARSQRFTSGTTYTLHHLAEHPTHTIDQRLGSGLHFADILTHLAARIGGQAILIWHQ